VIEIEIAVGVDENLDVGSDRLAHRLHALRILPDRIHDRTLVLVLERLACDRHLEPPETVGDPLLRGRCQLLAVEKAESECRVDRHALARTAKQLPDRKAERLALDVPEREIDRGERVRGIAGLTARHDGPVDLLPDAFGEQRIVADEVRRDHTVDHLRDHVLFGDGRQSVTDDAGVGLDLDIAGGQRGFPVDAHQRDVQRNIQRRCGDAGDFHSGLSGRFWAMLRPTVAVGSAGLILDLAYRRSTFYRQFGATHGGVRCTHFR
jgi:hypothetical protein